MKDSVVKSIRIMFRKVLGLGEYNKYTDEYVQYYDQEANDYILSRILESSSGLMISKFGTVELATILCLLRNQRGITLSERIRGLMGEIKTNPTKAINVLCKNAGFFPNDLELAYKYLDLVLKDAKEIDILGSYLKEEIELQDILSNAVRVNLDGYYAPFLWNNPWTQYLGGKRVLVVHPFVDSIKTQYERRDKLFQEPRVLPSFAELYLVKAVQSIAGNGEKTGFADWFEALESMKNEMDKYNYDVALIGCGAYGMNLAAHAKRNGKIAIHLAGWTQMLFGIYGHRWLKEKNKYSAFINEYWIRPGENEKPQNADIIENGCYW